MESRCKAQNGNGWGDQGRYVGHATNKGYALNKVDHRQQTGNQFDHCQQNKNPCCRAR